MGARHFAFRTITQLEARFNSKKLQRYDWMFLNDEEFTEEFKAAAMNAPWSYEISGHLLPLPDSMQIYLLILGISAHEANFPALCQPADGEVNDVKVKI
ncbi:hypothetical protein PG993_003827 [Apiospora rasikravindrae]|uniref:Uncharacterized protein n=1 Tax=Apiospora rasikravindrae TaxID=990691 RepID=A0ABR1U0P1_9PEZI